MHEVFFQRGIHKSDPATESMVGVNSIEASEQRDGRWILIWKMIGTRRFDATPGQWVTVIIDTSASLEMNNLTFYW